ncbi:MAG: pyridoxamine 5'-phosphate oxidase family protein [Leifsonia sp.]
MPDTDVVRDLDPAECWLRLAETDLGRIATVIGGELDIFPVNYYSDGSSILLRTAPGTKLLALTVHDAVTFEADAHTDDNAWSVVVKGRARQLEQQSEIDAADLAPLVPWIPTVKDRYVRIEPVEVTGRTFLRLPEPDREW